MSRDCLSNSPAGISVSRLSEQSLPDKIVSELSKDGDSHVPYNILIDFMLSKNPSGMLVRKLFDIELFIFESKFAISY